MSPEFQAVLEQRDELWDNHESVFLAGRIAVIVVALVFKRKRYAIPFMFAIFYLCISRDEAVFDRWWETLNAAAQNIDDRSWLASHDGGGLIAAGLEDLIRGFRNLILGLCIVTLRTLPRLWKLWMNAPV